MTMQAVLNRANTAVVIDTAGHILGSGQAYQYDDATITPANFAIIQKLLNAGRLVLLTGNVTIPPPSQGASYVGVTVSGQNLIFTDNLGGTTTVAIPGGNVDLTGYATTDALSSGLANKVNSSTYTAGLAAKADKTDLTGLVKTSDLQDANLATVATSGLFNDLTTPTGGIPASKLDTNGIANSAAIRAVTGGRINASGDTTGVTDYAAIQSALNGGQPVTLNSGQTYYINDTIYLPSASSLNAQGAIVHLIASKQQPVLATSSQKPSRTVTDAVSTAGSATVTSATAAFTSADVGNTVGIVGASYAGATWYGTITAVASATSATVSVPAVTAGTGLTMYVYNASARCSDVTVNGGWYIRDAAPADGRTPGVTAFNSFASNFRRVDRLTIVNTTWQVAQSSGSGGRFTVSVADANDVFIQNTRLLNINGDGVHLTGPINRAAVRDTFGTADDDFCVCNTVDGYTPLITDTEGSINNVTFDGIYPNNAFAAGKYYDNDTQGRFFAQGVTFRTVKGTVYKNPIRIDGAVSGCLIEDVKLTTPLGTSAVQINDARANGVTVRGVTWVSANVPTNGIVSSGGNDNNTTAPGNSLLVQDVTMTRAGGTGGVVLNIGSGSGLRNYTLEGFKSTVDQTELSLVRLNGGGLDKLSIRNVNLTATAGQLVNIAASTTVRHVLIDDVVATVPFVLNEPVSNATVYMKLSNVVFTGTSVATTRSPVHIDFTNTRLSTSGGVINLVGTGANARIRTATTVDQIGAGSVFTKDGTQACSLNGVTLPVDVTTLTPVDGDMVFNKSTAVTFGTGPAVYNAAAGQWRGLYSLTAAAGTAAPDTTAPTAPTTATATAGNAQAVITASGSTDNVGVTGYRVYAASTGGTALASGSSPITVTGLTNGTAYTFYVAAYDAAGNESTRTATNSVTPAAGSNPYPITTNPDFVLNADNATFTGSTLNTWTDSVGNLTYSVPSGRNAPTYSATGVNGKPGIVFTKANSAGLYYAKTNKPENMTIFIVFAPSVLGAGNGLLQATDNAASATNLGVNLYTNTGNSVVGGMQGNTGTNAFSGTTFSTANQGVMGRFTYNTGGGIGTSSAKAITSSLNGGTVGTGNTQAFTAVNATGFTLGGAGTTGSDVVIRKVYVYNTLLSTADQQAVTQWLGSLDSITVGTN